MSENIKVPSVQEYFFKCNSSSVNITGDLETEDEQLLKELKNEEDNIKNEIEKSRILVVGAGGIGCEVLKDLVLIGFKDIDIIDLDTIDVSNLNRQFLFRRCHVSQPKALIARQSALEFNPNSTINAYHDSIFNTQFGVSYIKNFRLVINALDNRSARNHVNRLCLAANVPLVETGTAGYHGQVEVILKGLTQCYECEPKPVQKSYPGCTIRNTPSEPVHCIVWAKHLFNQLFGEEDADNEVSPDSSDPELKNDQGEQGDQKDGSDTVGDGNIQRKSTREWAREENYDAVLLHKKFFIDDINYLLSMAALWKTRRPPTPSDISIESLNDQDSLPYKGLDRTMKVWNWRMCTKVFVDSLKILAERYQKLTDGDFLTWDKDDDVALDFVTACANIRSYIFNIPTKSRFDVKAIAGNIIPAIATTNAMVAALAIMQVLKILQNNMDKCTTIHLRKTPNPNGDLFAPERSIVPPNKNCYVCSPKPEITLEIDVNRTIVKQFEDVVLKQNLNLIAPDVMDPARSLLVISSEEGETEQNNNKVLKDLGITDGVILNADDFCQEYKINIIIKHKTQEGNDFHFKIIRPGDEHEKEIEPQPGPSKIAQLDENDVEVLQVEDVGGDGAVKTASSVDDDEPKVKGKQIVSGKTYVKRKSKTADQDDLEAPSKKLKADVDVEVTQ